MNFRKLALPIINILVFSSITYDMFYGTITIIDKLVIVMSFIGYTVFEYRLDNDLDQSTKNK